jgi:chromosome segregation ATPase
MATAAEQLKQILDDVARTGALTATAITQFDEYRKRVEDLEKQVASTTLSKNDALARSQAQSVQISQLNEQVAAQGKDLEKLRAESAAAQKAVWVAEFEKERRGEMRSILSDVFRNVEVHRAIGRTVVVPANPPSPSNTYGAPPYPHRVDDSETTTTG